MSTFRKIVLGFLTFLANICILSFFVMMIPMFYSSIFDPTLFEGNGELVGLVVFIQSLVTFFGFLLGFGLLIYYFKHINKNTKLNLEENEPAKWMFISVIGFTIGQFAYWYLKIWKEPKQLTSQSDV